MTKRATSRKDNRLQLVLNDSEAVRNGAQKRKTFSVLDMHNIKPLTDNQEKVFELFDAIPDTGLLLEGFPGTGKTFLAIYIALTHILSKNSPFKKLVIIRSTVPSRDMGFLKGTEEEKIAAYERPYVQLFDSIFKYKKAYENLKELGIVEFESTAFLRGTTFDDTIVILDEAQNCEFQEADTVATRIGTNSKFVVCGDMYQTDLKKVGEIDGAKKFFNLIRNMKSNDVVNFNNLDDIVRSGYTREVIMTKIRLGYM